MKTGEAKISAWAFGATVALAALWIGGTALAPALAARALTGLHGPASSASIDTAPDSNAMALVSGLYSLYRPVCHQLSDRAFHVSGYPMAVCARCLGIYSGFLFGLLAYPFARSLTRTDMPPRQWLITAFVPLGVDFLGGFVGAFENSPASRLVTGLIAGTAGAFYIMPGLVGMALSLRGSGPAARASAGREVSPEQ